MALPKSIGKLKKLRTLELTDTEDLESLPRSIGDCRHLQSLLIRHCERFREIPNTIGKNENLRVLEIADCEDLVQLPSKVIGEFGSIQTINLAESTGLTKLPEWITLVSTLEHLDLEDCRDLVELPRGIGSLTRLEVLNLKGCCDLDWLPSGIAQLSRLKRLGLYVVGHGEHDAKISDLENLDMLSGDMELKNLPHLMDSRDAEKACLKKKKNIKKLRLSWTESVMEEEFVSNLCVLDALEPPSEIKVLEIEGYQGSHLPCWMSRQSDSSCLETAMLCQTSQPRFLCLIELVLWELPNLEHMRGILVLPSLKTLHLNMMPKLEELWTTTSGLGIGEEEVSGQYCFPVLSHLEVHRCQKLIMEPYFSPSLEVLKLEECNDRILSLGRSSFPHVAEPLFSTGAFDTVPLLKELDVRGMMGPTFDWGFLQHQASLEVLLIWDCPALTALSEAIQHLTSLKMLEIGYCPALTTLPEVIQHLTSLRMLEIGYCPDLTALPEAIYHLTSLQKLSITGCPDLTALPEAIQHLTTLLELKIWSCSTLTALPEAIQHLTSLEGLDIKYCPALIALPKGIGQLSALHLLSIKFCSGLGSMPRSIGRLTALQSVCIWGCHPESARRSKKGVGDDCNLVSHIPRVIIIE
jgi:Leucine-rich repeat (LRR) protein